MLAVSIYTFFYVLSLFLTVTYFAARKTKTFTEANSEANATGPAWYVYIVTIPLYLWVSFSVGWDTWPVWMLWIGVAIGALWALFRSLTKRNLVSAPYLVFSFLFNTVVVFGLWSFV